MVKAKTGEVVRAEAGVEAGAKKREQAPEDIAGHRGGVGSRRSNAEERKEGRNERKWS